MAPDFGPLGLVIAAEGVAEGVGGGLVVALVEEDFPDAVAGKGAVLVGVEGLLVLDEGGGGIALGDELLAAEDGDSDGEVGGRFEEPAVGVDGDLAGAAKGFDGVIGVGFRRHRSS